MIGQILYRDTEFNAPHIMTYGAYFCTSRYSLVYTTPHMPGSQLIGRYIQVQRYLMMITQPTTHLHLKYYRAGNHRSPTLETTRRAAIHPQQPEDIINCVFGCVFYYKSRQVRRQKKIYDRQDFGVGGYLLIGHWCRPATTTIYTNVII